MAVTGHRRKPFTDIKNMKKEKLSLCIIVGNVENYIQRFIKSFSPLVDEIVFVRAIGNQEADKTKELAEALGATFAGDYQNKHDWPHVDDFAAARQMAFDAAHLALALQ